MRILYYDFDMHHLVRDADYPVGGAAVSNHAAIMGLVAQGVQVGVLSPKYAETPEHKRAPFELLPTYDPDEGIRMIRILTHRVPAVRDAVGGFRPDVLIQACAGLETGICAHVCRGQRVPFVHRIANDVDVDGRRERALPYAARVAYRYGLAHASGLIAQNDYQVRFLMRRFPNKPLVKIPNPFYFRGPLPGIAPPSDRSYVAWVGVFKRAKNLPLLLRLVRDMPGIEFRIAGKSREIPDTETEAALRELSRCANVRFVGYLRRTEVFPFLSRAALLVNTSLHEGFSNVLLEAFAAGTPVVLPDHVDPDGIVRKHSLGAVVDSGDRFSDVVRRYLESADRAEAPLRCRAYVRTHHDPAVLASRLTGFLAGVRDAGGKRYFSAGGPAGETEVDSRE